MLTVAVLIRCVQTAKQRLDEFRIEFRLVVPIKEPRKTVIVTKKPRRSSYKPDQLDELREQQNATSEEVKQLLLKKQEDDAFAQQAIENLQLEVTQNL